MTQNAHSDKLYMEARAKREALERGPMTDEARARAVLKQIFDDVWADSEVAKIAAAFAAVREEFRETFAKQGELLNEQAKWLIEKDNMIRELEAKLSTAREDCAKVAESPLGPGLCDYDDHWGPRIAKAIRTGQ